MCLNRTIRQKSDLHPNKLCLCRIENHTPRLSRMALSCRSKNMVCKTAPRPNARPTVPLLEATEPEKANPDLHPARNPGMIVCAKAMYLW